MHDDSKYNNTLDVCVLGHWSRDAVSSLQGRE